LGSKLPAARRRGRQWGDFFTDDATGLSVADCGGPRGRPFASSSERTNVSRRNRQGSAAAARALFTAPVLGLLAALVGAWLDTRHKRVLHPEETQTRVAIAAPVGSPPRLELAVAVLEEMRQQWWSKVPRRYLGAD
jgi:hypothetical protein